MGNGSVSEARKSGRRVTEITGDNSKDSETWKPQEAANLKQRFYKVFEKKLRNLSK